MVCIQQWAPQHSSGFIDAGAGTALTVSAEFYSEVSTPGNFFALYDITQVEA